MEQLENDLQDEKGHHLTDIAVDKHGFPLMPQPSRHKDDPLVSTMSSLSPIILTLVTELESLDEAIRPAPS